MKTQMKSYKSGLLGAFAAAALLAGPGAQAQEAKFLKEVQVGGESYRAYRAVGDRVLVIGQALGSGAIRSAAKTAPRCKDFDEALAEIEADLASCAGGQSLDEPECEIALDSLKEARLRGTPSNIGATQFWSIQSNNAVDLALEPSRAAEIAKKLGVSPGRLVTRFEVSSQGGAAPQPALVASPGSRVARIRELTGLSPEALSFASPNGALRTVGDDVACDLLDKKAYFGWKQELKVRARVERSNTPSGAWKIREAFKGQAADASLGVLERAALTGARLSAELVEGGLKATDEAMVDHLRMLFDPAALELRDYASQAELEDAQFDATVKSAGFEVRSYNE